MGSVVASFIAGGGAVFNVAVTATQAQAASLVRNVGKVLSSTHTQSANAGRLISRTLSVAQTLSVTVTRAVTRTVAAAQAQSATQTRRVGKAIAATQTQSATASFVKTVVWAVTAIQGQSATLTRNVRRSVTKNQRAGLPEGYPNLNMPMETRFYVPKLQAVKYSVAQPDAFNSKLPLIENHPYFQSVTIVRDIDVTLAARLADVPLDDFKALNPSVNRPVSLAAGTPQILLPWDNAEIFENNLQAYTGGRLASWTVWIAPTTMRPADAAKRVGMTEAELRSVNAVPARVVIRAGSTLLVPRAANIQDDVAGKVADNGQLSVSPEVVLRRTVVKAGKGDTVASVARARGVSATQLAQWNKVANNASFKPGQAIVLFLAPSTANKTNPPKSAPTKTAAKAQSQPVRKANSKPTKH